MQESTQNLLRLVHDAAFETALKGQFDEDRETVESILQSALNILEGKALLAQTGFSQPAVTATLNQSQQRVCPPATAGTC